MRIAVLGAGNVGQALGAGWVKKGHAVVYGVRNPDKYRDLDAPAMPLADAAKDAEVVTLATPWSAAHGALGQCGGLAGKIVLDCTNPLGPDLKLTVGHTDSGGETVARWAPQARVVKIFNTTGYNNMANPQYGAARATMFYAGDNGEARQVAAQLAADLGFDPVDAGPLRNARLLEPLACLWIELAYARGLGREIALILHKR
ncbi:MAG: NADPH-dependent F420 reductase [Acidobacteria bacterium]|nr:NADPH-dependent F420 reductase [Acidobacteriota bacterium]